MKNLNYLVLVLLLSFMYTNANAQKMAIGIEGGVNIANVSVNPTTTTDSRTGLIVGTLLDVNFTQQITLTPGIRFTMKGFSNTVNTVNNTVKLNYLEFPVLLKIRFPLTEIKPYLAAGPVLGLNLSANLDQSNGTQSATTDISSSTESIDFGLLFAGGMDFKVGMNTALFFQVGYQLGLSNINKTANNTTTIKNNAFQITGGVKFGI
jgi:hypothetical protein